jgi:hypothetical protein
MNKLLKTYISPMSQEIINGVVDIGKYGFAATRHQVDGYVCSDEELVGTEIICERDHGGNDVSKYLNDISNGYKILHIDPWDTTKDIEENSNRTAEIIEKIYSINPYILFEIGTEEKIYRYDEFDLVWMIETLKDVLPEKIFDNIKYVVIQGGAKVFNCTNIDFDERRFTFMVRICKRYKKFSKEHNCDFIGKEFMAKRIENGLDSYNIGPELIYHQNKYIMSKITGGEVDYIRQYCHNKNEWQRWTDKESLIVPTTLHYYYKELNIDTNINMKPIIEEIVI